MGFTHPSLINTFIYYYYPAAGVGYAAFLSLGERLVSEARLRPVRASQSFGQFAFQAVSLWVPPFS